MVDRQYSDGKEYWGGLENIQRPLMLEGIASNTERKLGNAIDGPYL